MSKKPILVYIIPTYNERENILRMLKVVTGILLKLKKYKTHILVIDDRSPDGTGNIVNKFKSNHTSVHLLSGAKVGLGNAMIKGYEYSIKKLQADIIVSNEADFSYNPAETVKMIKQIEKGVDVVFGSRKLTKVHSWSKERQIIHWVANILFASWVGGVNEIHDHNSAFKAIRVRGVLDKIDLNNFPAGFAFFNYITFRLLKISRKFYELNTEYYPRTKGESKISLKPKYFRTFMHDSWEYVLVCLRIRFERSFT